MKTWINIDMKWPALLSASFFLGGLGACAIHPGPDRSGYDREMGQYPETTRVREAGFTETGRVSYYAEKFHGRRTASGQTFDKNALTAAHRSLPFGTKVEVTNLDNGKSVVVVVNDRGPFKENRILDVSPAAARLLGLIGKGITRATVVVQ